MTEPHPENPMGAECHPPSYLWKSLLQVIGENCSSDIKQGPALIHVCATKTTTPFWKMDIFRIFLVTPSLRMMCLSHVTRS